MAPAQTRRALLGMVAAASVATALPALPQPGHVALLAERNRYFDWMNGHASDNDEEIDAQADHLNRLTVGVLDMPARSAADVIAKLLLLATLAAEGNIVEEEEGTSVLREARKFKVGALA